MAQARVARLVGHDIEWDRRIRNCVVDRRRNALILQCKQCKHGLHCPCCGKRVSDHGFVRRNGQCLYAFTENGRAAQILHFVIFGSAGSVCVDIIDVIRRKAGITDGIRDATDDRLSIGA